VARANLFNGRSRALHLAAYNGVLIHKGGHHRAVVPRDCLEVFGVAERVYHRVSGAGVLAVVVAPPALPFVQETLGKCSLREAGDGAISQLEGYELLISRP
jgi:hypothetical protein